MLEGDGNDLAQPDGPVTEDPTDSLPDGDTTQEVVVRAYVAFEGGGARGIAHVGFLRALEFPTVLPDGTSPQTNGDPSNDRPEGRFEILGAAGTSAGAIVAALTVAGYTSEELFSKDGKSSILKKIGARKMTDLFGYSGWKGVRLFRDYVSNVDSLLSLVIAVIFLFLVIGETLVPHPSHLWVLSIAVVLLVSIFYPARRFLSGLCLTGPVRAAVNTALALKLELDPDRDVTFEKLFEKSEKPLRIVATNLDTRSLVLFSEERTPHVAVADAVAASIAIPFIFKPHEIRRSAELPPDAYVPEGRYVDGGLVSNLPAWTFDEELEKDPDTIVLCSEIPDKASSKKRNRVFGPFIDLIDLIRATAFGGSLLNKRMKAGRLYSVQLEPETTNAGKKLYGYLEKASLLGFDHSADFYKNVVEDANLKAQSIISSELIERPVFWNKICREVYGIFMKAFFAKGTASLGKETKVRVNLMMQDPDYPSFLRIVGQYNMAGDPDEDLLLPLEGSGPGLCFEENEAILVPEAKTVFGEDEDVGLAGDRNRFRRALVWDDVEWFLSIPADRMYEETEDLADRFVVTIDSNIPAENVFAEDIAEEMPILQSVIRKVNERVEEELTVKREEPGLPRQEDGDDLMPC